SSSSAGDLRRCTVKARPWVILLGPAHHIPEHRLSRQDTPLLAQCDPPQSSASSEVRVTMRRPSATSAMPRAIAALGVVASILGAPACSPFVKPELPGQTPYAVSEIV